METALSQFFFFLVVAVFFMMMLNFSNYSPLELAYIFNVLSQCKVISAWFQQPTGTLTVIVMNQSVTVHWCFVRNCY